MPPGSASKRALITGFTGQDGSFLAELLLEEGYDVSGLVRDPQTSSLGASEHLRGQVELVSGDLLDHARLRSLVELVQPDEIYHLASPSFVPASWECPAQALTAVAGGTVALLEGIRAGDPAIRLFVASSGAIFGDCGQSPQREDTACRPQTPYAIAKLAGHLHVGVLRAHDDLYACSGILYNHESERRPDRFVSRKITRGAAAIKLGLANELALGDLDAVRDWSFAGDIVRGAWLMLQQPRAQDYILASGVPHTVGELAEIAFACVDLEAQHHIRCDPQLMRPADPTTLIGDPAKARRELGWYPELSFEQLVERMVHADLRSLQAQIV